MFFNGKYKWRFVYLQAVTDCEYNYSWDQIASVFVWLQIFNSVWKPVQNYKTTLLTKKACIDYTAFCHRKHF